MIDILASLINEPDTISDDLIESMREYLVGRDESQVIHLHLYLVVFQ